MKNIISKFHEKRILDLLSTPELVESEPLIQFSENLN